MYLPAFPGADVLHSDSSVSQPGTGHALTLFQFPRLHAFIRMSEHGCACICVRLCSISSMHFIR